MDIYEGVISTLSGKSIGHLKATIMRLKFSKSQALKIFKQSPTDKNKQKLETIQKQLTSANIKYKAAKGDHTVGSLVAFDGIGTAAEIAIVGSLVRKHKRKKDNKRKLKDELKPINDERRKLRRQQIKNKLKNITNKK